MCIHDIMPRKPTYNAPMVTTNIKVPLDILKRAHELGLNVSAEARKGIVAGINRAQDIAAERRKR